MIVVKVELHSAVTGKVTDLGTAVIDNVGRVDPGGKRCNYRSRAFRKGTWARFKGYWQPSPGFALVRKAKPTREGSVLNHPRHSAPVWSLVRKSLESMGY